MSPRCTVYVFGVEDVVGATTSVAGFSAAGAVGAVGAAGAVGAVGAAGAAGFAGATGAAGPAGFAAAGAGAAAGFSGCNITVGVLFGPIATFTSTSAGVLSSISFLKADNEPGGIG